MSPDFDWSRDNGSVVLRAYGSVAVHENPYGDVVIRQERDALEEDDHFVVVPMQDAELIAHAIIEKAAEIKAATIAAAVASASEARSRDSVDEPAPNFLDSTMAGGAQQQGEPQRHLTLLPPVPRGVA